MNDNEGIRHNLPIVKHLGLAVTKFSTEALLCILNKNNKNYGLGEPVFSVQCCVVKIFVPIRNYSFAVLDVELFIQSYKHCFYPRC